MNLDTYSERLLKLELVKLLPEQIDIIQQRRFYLGPKRPVRFYWKDTCEQITDREWLHVCREVEQRLMLASVWHGAHPALMAGYRGSLVNVVIGRGVWNTGSDTRQELEVMASQSASWQQRATCLIESFKLVRNV